MRGDGLADDTAALQAAVDKAASTPDGGILFVPSGRYRLTRTIYVWRGVRLIGYGATRPVFVLGDKTPGYQQGIGLMVMFTHASPGSASRAPGSTKLPFPPPGMVPPRDDIPDAGPSTFYPAMSNIDFEIGRGNPAAVAIRFHVAQHGYLSHMDFEIGSGPGGIDPDRQRSRRPLLPWRPLRHPHRQHVTVLAVHADRFDLRRPARRRHPRAHGGPDAHQDTFRNVPVAIDIDPHYSDQLWVQDSRFEHVSKAAVIVSNETQRDDPGRRRECRLQRRPRVRALPREREDPRRRRRRRIASRTSITA